MLNGRSVYRIARRFGRSGGVCLMLLLAGCQTRSADDEQEIADARQPAEGGGPPPGREARPGIQFAPDSLQVGDQVGDLLVDAIAATQTIVDSTYVGTARFDGEIPIGGATFLHPDVDLRTTKICFEADDTSAARLPRWRGDERRPWFCFENPEAASRLMGSPSEGVEAALVIDRFTIHRGLSDEVNSARLVRLTAGPHARGSATPGLAWLAGCWEQDDGEIRIEERWMNPRGDILLGMSRTTRGDSLVGFEFMRIFGRGDTTVFAAQPSGVPPSEFPAVATGEREILFENPAHDFPQRVRYRARGGDSLFARIEGTIGGSVEGVDFHFGRVDCP